MLFYSNFNSEQKLEMHQEQMLHRKAYPSAKNSGMS